MTEAPAPESLNPESMADMSNSDMLGLLGTERKLPDEVRGKMESSFNADFSSVKVYESSAIGDMGAQAFAKGNVIGFDRGKFDPGSESGQSLLGHELSHVMQQTRGEVSSPMAKGLPVTENSALEARADHEGAMAAKGLSVGGGLTPLSAGMSAGGGVQLKADKHGMGKSERRAYDAKLKNLRGQQETSEKQNIAGNKQAGSLRGDIDYTGLNQRQAENVSDFETRLGQVGDIGSRGAQTGVLRDMYRARANSVAQSSMTSMALSDLMAGEQMGSKAFRRADTEMTDIMGAQGKSQNEMLELMDYLRRVSGKRDYDSSGNEIFGSASKGRTLVVEEMRRRGMSQDMIRMNLDEAFMNEGHRMDDVTRYANTLQNGTVEKGGDRITEKLHRKKGDLYRILLTFGRSAGASPEERESSGQYNRGFANAMLSDNAADANPYLEGIVNDMLTMDMPDLEPLASTPDAFSEN